MIGALGVLALNLLAPSLLNFYHWSPSFSRWQSFLAHIVDLHARIVGPFTARPVTTFLIQHLSSWLSLSHWWGFLLAQLLLLSAAACALARLSQRLGARPEYSLVVFFLSFSVLFSFVTPNDSYDEAAQYFFLFLALIALTSRRDFPFAASFFLALLSRETSALLLPGLLLLGWSGWKRSWKFFLPLALYFAYYLTRDTAPDPNRFLYWSRNFQSFTASFETIVSFMIALALPAGLFVAGLRSGWAKINDPWIRAFLLTLAINSLVVSFSAYARESRLYALPLVFLWPLTGKYLGLMVSAWQKKRLQMALRPAHWAGAIAFFAALIGFYAPHYRFPYYHIMAPAYFLVFLFFAALRSRPKADKPAVFWS